MGAQAEMMQENARTMGTILLLALFFAFVVLAILFESYRLPLIILASVPFCLSGMVFALGLTHFAIGATVAIGVFIVIGACVNDGVLLVTFAEKLRTDGHAAPFDAVVRAATIRLRPRVMRSYRQHWGMLYHLIGRAREPARCSTSRAREGVISGRRARRRPLLSWRV